MSIDQSSMSRRAFVRGIAGTAALSALPTQSVTRYTQKASITAAQMRAGGVAAKIVTMPVRNNVRALMGSGGNIVVLPGPDGKILVDTGLATSRTQITKALAAISPEPLRHVIDTHWHFDHTDGNEWMHEIGATIIAQEKVRERMSSRQTIPAFDAVLSPSPAAALPTILFRQTHKVALNGEVIHLRRLTPAHTDTDIAVFFTNANVLHTGDTFFNGYYPFIDYNSGGSIVGLLAASKESLSRADENTVVVPGHGDLGTHKDLVEFDEMIVSIHEKVKELKKSGRSLDEVIAEKPTSKFDAKWGGGFISPSFVTELVFVGA
ncbi:MAG TPA: MBL fold metallo-hydrolase [Dongiaceae bacterium]|nr:MBL fold metallo-hydrolase [Dongiaceae bacterium]